ncbi:hypothetical protein ABT297_04000 [Dactylosporangium sp. NPDC000555]|uniref:hypothetical protein n=1 Tax=Dactylosporangium sp. NPDC000555 TaxID=3154260 RepID=UPI00332559B2
MTVRAKFRCTSVELSSMQPATQQRYVGGGQQPIEVQVWPRTFKFSAIYDTSVPEDQRYATATPYAELRIQVDNPAVSFEPGKSYYLDFTDAEE